jgi:hypothetical protein
MLASVGLRPHAGVDAMPKGGPQNGVLEPLMNRHPTTVCGGARGFDRLKSDRAEFRRKVGFHGCIRVLRLPRGGPALLMPTLVQPVMDEPRTLRGSFCRSGKQGVKIWGPAAELAKIYEGSHPDKGGQTLRQHV